MDLMPTDGIHLEQFGDGEADEKDDCNKCKIICKNIFQSANSITSR